MADVTEHVTETMKAHDDAPSAAPAAETPETQLSERRRAWRDWRVNAGELLRARSTLPWYFGASFGLLYQIPTMVTVWTSPGRPSAQVLVTVLLAVVYLAFLVLPPLLWCTSTPTKFVMLCGYWAFTVLLVPSLGIDVVWLWIFVAIVAAVTIELARSFYPVLGTVIVAQLAVILIASAQSYFYIAPLLTASLGVAMFAMNRQLAGVRSLREANSEIARLAVIEERARFSRDLHDVLGHSLTVVAVKSELAQRLVEIDPQRARAEIADIERLSRDALTDLRAAVSNYREVSLETELVSAGKALAAAGIQAHLPDTSLDVPAETAAFFSWVLREGVTNVIRHSSATSCWVGLEPQTLTIADDGQGARLFDASRYQDRSGTSGTSGTNGTSGTGNGLRGLHERAAAAGATITVGPSEQGGFQLTASRRVI